ncbi:MAG TPA: PepSY domain-containing protein, partial [Thermoanaerobaculia bacterium]
MKKTLVTGVALAALLTLTPAYAAKETQAELQKETKISMKKARSIALKKVEHGKIASEELEREKGKLIYSFDVKNEKGSVTEVNVDAINGKVVDVHEESAAKEAAEKKQE